MSVMVFIDGQNLVKGLQRAYRTRVHPVLLGRHLAGDREVVVGIRLLDGPEGVEFQHAVLPLRAKGAGEIIGERYLVGFDADGRVLDVVSLESSRQEAVVRWLSRGRVTGNDDRPGWVSVETVVAK